MKKIVVCAVMLVVLSVSSAFCEATDDLLKMAEDKNTTPQMIQNLIKSGADVNAQDNDGYTALMRAAFDSSKLEVINTLLNAGADIRVANNYGKTVLDYAATGEIKRYRREKHSFVSSEKEDELIEDELIMEILGVNDGSFWFLVSNDIYDPTGTFGLGKKR